MYSRSRNRPIIVRFYGWNRPILPQSRLESYLWGAATLLRGHIDAGDYKQFIFPLLFYKRLCDVYDEELNEVLEESGGDVNYAELPEHHRFQIPADAHWKVTRSIVKEVGKVIQDALRKIERANPDTLYGLFGDAQWTNKDRLPDHMLLSAAAHLKRRNKEWRNFRLFGRERNLFTSAIGRMSLFLHGIKDFRIVRAH